MELLLKGNTYTNYFFMLFGLIGATFYFLEGSYTRGGILALVGFAYLAKILEPLFRKR
ncbi:hypothetical protein [Zobellia uliginosa]|uniref:hypothetical protein n=1 Tax=Zobellia uliginosa TaxID=143224 RepID=UPI001C069160|nr:hypothetical protein [Zobellia uliginosa]MBU2945415.1 hypothetical protein [Zobellia uliginosa]